MDAECLSPWWETGGTTDLGGHLFISQLEWTVLSRQFKQLPKTAILCSNLFFGFSLVLQMVMRDLLCLISTLIELIFPAVFWLVNFVLSLPILSALVSKVSFELTEDELKLLLLEPTSPFWLDRREPPCLAFGVFWDRMSLCSPGWTQPWSNWFTSLCLLSAGIIGVHPPTFWLFWRGGSETRFLDVAGLELRTQRFTCLCLKLTIYSLVGPELQWPKSWDYELNRTKFFPCFRDQLPVSGSNRRPLPHT